MNIADSIETKAGRVAMNNCMSDERATRLLKELTEDEYVLKIKCLKERLGGRRQV